MLRENPKNKNKKRVNSKKTPIFWMVVVLISIFSIIPFYEMFQNNSIIYVVKYILLALFILLLFNKVANRGIQWNKLMILATTLSFISLLSLINITYSASTFYIDAITNITMYVLVAILALFIFPKIKTREFKSILSIFIIIVLVFVTIPALINIPNAMNYIEINNRIRYLAMFNNPNELSRFALLGAALAIRLWIDYKGFFKKIFLLFMIFSNSYLIFLTDSRTSLIALSVLIIVIISVNIYKVLSKQLFILTLLSVLSLILIAVFYVINFADFNLNFNADEVSSGRVSIWSGILSNNVSSLILGSGYIVGPGSHNGYLEILSYFGIIGVVFWLFIISYLLIQKIKGSLNNEKNINFTGVGIVLIFLVYHLFEGSLVSLANITSIYIWLELSQRNKE